jgi:hypothetical protein
MKEEISRNYLFSMKYTVSNIGDVNSMLFYIFNDIVSYGDPVAGRSFDLSQW